MVVRNRLATLASRNQRKVIDGLEQLSTLLGFRIADGISERVIFRELFPTGLTAFDTLDRRMLGVEPTMSHVAAAREIRELVDSLNLPGARRNTLPGGGRRPSLQACRCRPRCGPTRSGCSGAFSAT